MRVSFRRERQRQSYEQSTLVLIQNVHPGIVKSSIEIGNSGPFLTVEKTESSVILSTYVQSTQVHNLHLACFWIHEAHRRLPCVFINRLDEKGLATRRARKDRPGKMTGTSNSERHVAVPDVFG